MPTRRVRSALMDRRASLFYFAAAVPTVGFVHGPADVNPLDEGDARNIGSGRGAQSVREG